jgi:hypothetical protein
MYNGKIILTPELLPREFPGEQDWEEGESEATWGP